MDDDEDNEGKPPKKDRKKTNADKKATTKNGSVIRLWVVQSQVLFLESLKPCKKTAKGSSWSMNRPCKSTDKSMKKESKRNILDLKRKWRQSWNKADRSSKSSWCKWTAVSTWDTEEITWLLLKTSQSKKYRHLFSWTQTYFVWSLKLSFQA